MNNFAVRSISSLAFVIIMVAGLLFSPYGFEALMLLVMTMALQEFFGMALGGRYVLQQKIALIAAAVPFFALVGMLHFGIDSRWLAASILPLVCLPISVIFRKDHSDVGDFAYIYAGLASIAVPVCSGLFLAFRGGEFSGILMLCVFIMIWLSDSGAYCLGTLLGQKPGSIKLSPSISPKKSLWGLVGGIISCIASAVVLKLVGILQFSMVHCLVLGLIISFTAVCGDLYESLWKRWFHVKDSGNAIPGHGGIYDRFDSSFMAIPSVVLYLALTGLL